MTNLLLILIPEPFGITVGIMGRLSEGTGGKRRYNKWILTVFTVIGLKFPPFPSRPSSSYSFSGRKVCGISFSSFWFGSLGSVAPPSPWSWWRPPPFPHCSGSASIPRCSDPPPALPGDPSRWEFRLSTDAKGQKRSEEQCAQIMEAV